MGRSDVGPEFWWRVDDYEFECDGIPETLPEPSPAEVAVIAEIAGAAGVTVCPNRLLDALMSDSAGPQLIYVVRAGGDPSRAGYADDDLLRLLSGIARALRRP